MRAREKKKIVKMFKSGMRVHEVWCKTNYSTLKGIEDAIREEISCKAPEQRVIEFRITGI